MVGGIFSLFIYNLRTIFSKIRLLMITIRIYSQLSWVVLQQWVHLQMQAVGVKR